MKNKKERTSRGTLLFLNIKLLPVGDAQGYIDFFKNLLNKDFAVQVAKDTFVSLFNFLPMDPEGKVYMGRLVEYLSLDPEGYIDVANKEKIVEPFESSSVGANSKSSYFYFVPEAHRLAVFKHGGISFKRVQKFIESAGERLLTESNDNRELFVIVQKTSNAIEVLKNAFAITSLKAKLSYSNKDLTGGFEGVFDNKVSTSGANEVELNLKTNKGGVLSFEDDSLPSAIANISEDNGTLEARIIKHEGGKTETFNTQSYPREERIKYKPSNIGFEIYNIVMRIWRTNKE